MNIDDYLTIKLNIFKDIFERATGNISYFYMKIPVAGERAPLFRERIYCYELYHQIKIIFEQERFDFELCGELDKSGHPIIYGNNLDNAKPDLIIHKPSDMSLNLAVIEIKPIKATSIGIVKDLKRLTAFRRVPANYHSAIYLFYSDETGDANHDLEQFNKIRSFAQRMSKVYPDEIDLSLVDLFWHSKCNIGATQFGW